MHTTDQPEETLSEGATPRAPGASAGDSAGETTEDEPTALTSALRPSPPTSNGGAAAAVEGSPFASLKRTVLPVLPSTERPGATTEAYSVRLPTELKRRLMEAVQREGGRAAPLFEQLLEAHETQREETEGDMAEKFVRTRRNIEGHLRALVVTLTADLRDLAADEEAHEAEAADLVRALHEAKRQASQEREEFEAKARRFAQERTAESADLEAALATRSQLEEERAELRASLRALHHSLADARTQTEAAAGHREKFAKMEQKLSEAEQRAARTDLHREEAELKLARAVEDLARMRRNFDENEALRVRQHETAEEERKALHARSAAERERLEATIERLQTRMSEMTRESGR
jgi:hypothetical protein